MQKKLMFGGVAVALGVAIWFALSTQIEAPTTSEATAAPSPTSMGQETIGLNVTVTPREVISDSRCPEGTQCVSAGGVEVRALVATQAGQEEQVFKLGEPRIFGSVTITLTDVTPYPKGKTKIPEDSYRFLFEMKKL